MRLDGESELTQRDLDLLGRGGRHVEIAVEEALDVEKTGVATIDQLREKRGVDRQEPNLRVSRNCLF